MEADWGVEEKMKLSSRIVIPGIAFGTIALLALLIPVFGLRPTRQWGASVGIRPHSTTARRQFWVTTIPRGKPPPERPTGASQRAFRERSCSSTSVSWIM